MTPGDMLRGDMIPADSIPAEPDPAGTVRSARVRALRTVGYWLALAVAVLVGALPLLPPAAERDPGAEAFSVELALAHVEVIARRPRPSGSAENRIVREYLLGQLRDLGLDPQTQTVGAPDWYGGSDRTVPVVNVIARIPGTASTGAVALVGHYDTVPISPGANDDASAVAVMLESARAILAGDALRNDVLLIFTDGEEPAPRFGSTAFVEDHPWSSDTEFVINLEAVGSGGPSQLIETAGPERWVVEGYVSGAPHPAAFSFLTDLTELIGGSNTDFAPFRDAGVAGVEFAYAHGSPIYHTSADAVGRVSDMSLQQHGANALGLARSMGEADFSAARDGSGVVFFTLGRSWVVRYPATWGLLATVVAGALLAVAIWRLRVVRQALRDLASLVVTLVAVVTLATVLWALLSGWRDTMGIAESYLYLGMLVALAAVLVSAAHRLFASRWAVPSAPGVLLLWWVLAVLLLLSGPGTSYLFCLPVLLGALTLLVVQPCPDHGVPWVAATVTSFVAVVLAVPAIDILFQFAQPRPGNPDSEVLAAVAVPVAYVVLLIELAASLRPQRSSATG